MKQFLYILDEFTTDNLNKWAATLDSFNPDEELGIILSSIGGETIIRDTLLIRLSEFKNKTIYAVGDVSSNAVYLFLMIEAKKVLNFGVTFNVHHTCYRDIREDKLKLLKKKKIQDALVVLRKNHKERFAKIEECNTYERELLKPLLTESELDDIYHERTVTIDPRKRMKGVVTMNLFNKVLEEVV